MVAAIGRPYRPSAFAEIARQLLRRPAGGRNRPEVAVRSELGAEVRDRGSVWRQRRHHRQAVGRRLEPRHLTDVGSVGGGGPDQRRSSKTIRLPSRDTLGLVPRSISRVGVPPVGDTVQSPCPASANRIWLRLRQPPRAARVDRSGCQLDRGRRCERLHPDLLDARRVRRNVRQHGPVRGIAWSAFRRRARRDQALLSQLQRAVAAATTTPRSPVTAASAAAAAAYRAVDDPSPALGFAGCVAQRIEGSRCFRRGGITRRRLSRQQSRDDACQRRRDAFRQLHRRSLNDRGGEVEGCCAR